MKTTASNDCNTPRAAVDIICLSNVSKMEVWARLAVDKTLSKECKCPISTVTYVVGDVVLICKKAAMLNKKLKIPATKTWTANLCNTISEMVFEMRCVYSPLRRTITEKIGAIANALVYTKSNTPNFNPETYFFMTIVSIAVVRDDQIPHAIPAVEVWPIFSPETPKTNPHIVIPQARRARVPGREFGRNAADSAIVKGNNNPRAIW